MKSGGCFELFTCNLIPLDHSKKGIRWEGSVKWFYKDLSFTEQRNLEAIARKLSAPTKPCFLVKNRGEAFETFLFREKTSGVRLQGLNNVLIAVGKNVNTD